MIDYICEVAEYVPIKEGRITVSRCLRDFFDPAMQYTWVEKLRGEKREDCIFKNLDGVLNASFFFLDEPGNVFDILNSLINSFFGGPSGFFFRHVTTVSP